MRNTRAVKLTDAGADFLSRVEPVLAELEDAEQAVRETGELRGALRVSVGSSLAVREVIPRLPGFLERRPALQVDLLLVDHRQDLVTEGIDVALRFGPLADSTATVHHTPASSSASRAVVACGAVRFIGQPLGMIQRRVRLEVMSITSVPAPCDVEREALHTALRKAFLELARL